MAGLSPVFPVDLFAIALNLALPPESVSRWAAIEARQLSETLLHAELYYLELRFTSVVGISLGLNAFALSQCPVSKTRNARRTL
jgi:hypothetical protein